MYYIFKSSIFYSIFNLLIHIQSNTEKHRLWNNSARVQILALSLVHCGSSLKSPALSAPTSSSVRGGDGLGGKTPTDTHQDDFTW